MEREGGTWCHASGDFMSTDNRETNNPIGIDDPALDVLGNANRMKVNDKLHTIDSKLKPSGHHEIAMTNDADDSVWYEVARKYMKAGWIVKIALSGPNRMLSVKHPMLVNPCE
jgi:hypothetical protein